MNLFLVPYFFFLSILHCFCNSSNIFLLIAVLYEINHVVGWENFKLSVYRSIGENSIREQFLVSKFLVTQIQSFVS